MSRTSTLILLGILIILTPFSGLPMALRSLLAVIFGACVSSIGVMLRASDARNHQQSSEPSAIPEVAPEPSAPTEISSI